MARRTKEREEATGLMEVDQQQPTPTEGTRLTPVDVQQKVFRLAFRGYNERDVDEFLDEITESLAQLHEENKRLREQLQDASGSAGATAAAQRQAEAIVRQAREEAARISDRSRTEDAPAAGAPAPPSFLVRERAFLQRIAGLVQDHAHSLKEDARRLRRGGKEETAAAGAAAAAAAAGAGGQAVEGEPAEGEPPISIPEASGEPPRPESPTAGEEMPSDGRTEPASRPEPEPADAGMAVASSGPEAVGMGSEGSGDATAPWRPQEGTEDADWAGSSTDDPLVSAWESAFAAEGAQSEGEASGEGSGQGSEPGAEKEEPSLRELFWGEE